MKKLIKGLRKSKKGSEIVQVLIIIAVMGTLAIYSISNISKSINTQNNKVLSTLETSLNQAANKAQGL